MGTVQVCVHLVQVVAKGPVKDAKEVARMVVRMHVEVVAVRAVKSVATQCAKVTV